MQLIWQSTIDLKKPSTSLFTSKRNGEVTSVVNFIPGKF